MNNISTRSDSFFRFGLSVLLTVCTHSPYLTIEHAMIVTEGTCTGTSTTITFLYNNYKVRCVTCSICLTQLKFAIDIYQFANRGADNRTPSISTFDDKDEINARRRLARCTYTSHSPSS